MKHIFYFEIIDMGIQSENETIKAKMDNEVGGLFNGWVAGVGTDVGRGLRHHRPGRSDQGKLGT